MEFSRVRPKVSMPKSSLKWVMIVIGLALVILLGGAAYVWFSGGTSQASSAISAPSLQVSPTGKLFAIKGDQSEVRFITHETLLGNPKTVVGTTNEVAGEIMLDFANPANSQLGMIRINVKTLTTDNEFRNRALRSQILQSTLPEFEFATFIPTKLVGLPEAIKAGDTVKFQIVGNLTVHGVSREVTFDTAVTLTDQTRLEGTAQATVQITDFNITIPEAPGVANVSKDIQLEIEFVAQAETI
jgi:polyisoprenoid-binding protein YceI